MPRNGSGIYGPPAGTTAVPNTPIESAKYNAFVADAAEALTNSVNVSGTAPFQANQPMGGFKHTNLGAGSASGDSANLGQAQSSIVAHATVVGGTADAITATFSPAFAAWTAKMRFRFTAGGANTVTDPTVNVDGLGTKTIKKLNGVALGLGDIQGSGHVCECVYDGTDVILLNPALVLGTGANVFTAKQTFNGPVVHGLTTLTDAATIVWDLSAGGPDYEVTITSNRTLGAFTGSTDGQEGTLRIKQDGTGGWSLNLGNAVYDYWGPVIENVARGANDVTEYDYKVFSSSSMILKRRGATSIGNGGRDLLDVKIASSSATIDFVLTKWLQLYDRFEIDLEDIQAATDDVGLNMVTSSNGGSSYDTGAANYAYAWSRNIVSGGGADAGAGNDTKFAINITAAGSGLSNVAGETGAGTIVIFNPRLTAKCKVRWMFCAILASPAAFLSQMTAVGVRDAAAKVDAIRFSLSSGNIASGFFRLYGIRG